LDNNKIKQGNLHYKHNMHITISEYQTANPFSVKDDRMKERIREENSFKLAVLNFNDFSRLSIDLNIAVCIFADSLI